MKNGKRVGMAALLLCGLMIFGLFGCGRKPPADPDPDEPEPIDGGTTDRTDADAPKQIVSKQITGFRAQFYLDTRWTAEEEHFFDFRVEPDAQGVLTASEKYSGLSRPADDALLTALQTVVDRRELAKRNGVWRVTAGLAPEYSDCRLRVRYASGETLSFTVDNNPAAQWAEDFYSVFADWFRAQGDDALYPQRESSQLTRLSILLIERGVQTEYGIWNVGEKRAIDGQTRLLGQQIRDLDSGTTLAEAYMLVPEDYFARLTDILAGYELDVRYEFSYLNHESGQLDNHDLGFYGMSGAEPDYTEPDADDALLSLYLEYESGRRMSIDTQKASEIAAMAPMLTELLEYHAALFASAED